MLVVIFQLLREITSRWCSSYPIAQAGNSLVIRKLSQHLKKHEYLYHRCFEFLRALQELKTRKKEQAERLPREAAGVAYGNPAHILNAAQYIKFAWDAISDATMKNAFKKAELLNL